MNSAADKEGLLPAAGDDASVWQILAAVNDPEIPVLNIIELGIVRHVRFPGPEIGITATYSGCPAMHWITAEVAGVLRRAGYSDVRVVEVLAPPWSSAWISDAGRQKLAAFGIAPPDFARNQPAACPHCGANESELISEFGSTPCKSLYRCCVCMEPFDYFKCH